MLNMKNKMKRNFYLPTKNGHKCRKNKTKTMFFREGKTIEPTHKTKVVEEEVVVDIKKNVEGVEEATT